MTSQSTNINNTSLLYQYTENDSVTDINRRINTIPNNSHRQYNQVNTIQNHHQLQQIIDTFTIYIKSANQLKNYISIPNQYMHNKKEQIQQNSFNKLSNILGHSSQNKSINKQSQSLTLIVAKINMFLATTQSQLNKLQNTIQSSSLSQLKSLPINYSQILNYTKGKYSELLKQTYRTLNIETLLSHQQLNQSDQIIVKQNKKRKLQEIKVIERELQDIWNHSPQNNQRNTFNYNIHTQIMDPFQNTNYQSQQSPQLIVSFTSNESHNPRNLQILQISNNNSTKQLNLRQLARQQLEKQFLTIRIQAYNMYEKYINHSHKQHEERLNFVKQEQQIIEAQLNEEIELAQSINQEYHRLKRELSEVKTINQLIKKRYILRESIIMHSDNSLYHNQSNG